MNERVSPGFVGILGSSVISVAYAGWGRQSRTEVGRVVGRKILPDPPRFLNSS